MARKFLAASAAFLMISQIAVAATAPVAQLQVANGKVLINQGKGFVPATGLLALNAGDKVMVGKDSSATILYTEANCSVDVSAATVMAVAAKAPCTGEQTVGAVDSVFVHSAASEPSSMATAGVLVGSAVVLGSVVAYMATNDNGGNSVSAP